ncbi:MAG: hypothetical protein NTZ82_04480 [Bacteroidetes bacterium]|nr:hypothetical protein [Bacteroidota bacterium]
MRFTPLYNILFLLSLVLLTSCQHDIINQFNTISKDTVFVVTPPKGNTPGGTSVSDTICFNTEILPIYVSYCASAGCHDLGSHREGVVTTSYSYIMNGIRAKNVTGSKYYTIIGNGMPPKSSPQMTTAHIASIKKWIEQGALNTSCTNVCDTTVYTYSGAIQTILSNNCGGCHGTSPGSANVYIGNYASTKAYVTANKSIFLNAINYSTTITASKRMPPSGKMVDCKIIQIQKWINNGYPQ